MKARLHDQLSCFDAVDVQQILDQPVGAPRRALDDLDLLPLHGRGGREELREEPRRHVDGAHRVAEVVRDDARHIVASPQGAPGVLVQPRVVHRERGPPAPAPRRASHRQR
jgi:hypothetical protein